MLIKTKSKKMEGCTVTFEIEIPQADVREAREEVIGDFAKVAELPGFRPGKAPRELVAKRYHAEVNDEAVKNLVKKSCESAFREHHINPVTLPEVSQVSQGTEGPLAFRISVDVSPEVSLKPYKGIKLTRKVTELKEEDVNKYLENLKVIHGKYVSVEDRPLRMGDYAVCDIDCFIDGKPLHRRRENFWIFVDKESSVPSLTEQMVGLKKDEERSCHVAIPETYSDKKLAGKTATYRVKLKEVKVRQVPALDDEFAKDLGKDSFEVLKDGVRKGFEIRIESETQKDLERQVLAKLILDNDFCVPSSFVERQLRYLVENAKVDLVEKGIRKNDVDAKEGELREKLKGEAARRVKAFFILDDISKREGIACTPEEIEEALVAIAVETGIPIEKVKEHYERENLLQDLAEKLREEKTIRFLIEAAVIT